MNAVPNHNPDSLSHWWLIEIENNPVGRMPLLNPEAQYDDIAQLINDDLAT